MKAKWVSASIGFTLKNPPKDHRGLRSTKIIIGRDHPTDLRRIKEIDGD